MNVSVDQITLTEPATRDGVFAQGTNDLGEIVGHYFDLDDLAHGYLSSNGAIITLDHPSAVQGTFAESINNSGEIVGYFYDDADIAHGFFYRDGAYVTLDEPAAMFGTFAESINDIGDIAGFYYDAAGEPRAFALAAQDSGLRAAEIDPPAEPVAEPVGVVEVEPIRVGHYQSSFLIDEPDREVAPIGEEVAAEAGPPPAVPLNGYIDRVTATTVEGWAQNPEKPEEPVCLDMFIMGARIETTLANRYRADLEAAGLGSGRHAFMLRLPPALTAAQRKSITVRRTSDQLALIDVRSKSKTQAA